MKVLDAAPLKEGIKGTLSAIQTTRTDITGIQKAVESVTSLQDELAGEMGDAIRSFYQTCHQPFLIYAHEVLADYAATLKKSREAMHTFDPVDTAYVKQMFLENDVQRDLNKIKDTASDLTEEANGIMDNISDIVALPKLKQEALLESIRQGKKKAKTTIEQLHELDRSQTAKLDEVLTDIKTMETYISEIASKINSGAMSVSTFDVNTISKLPEHQKMLERIYEKEAAAGGKLDGVKNGELSENKQFGVEANPFAPVSSPGALINRSADTYGLADMHNKVRKGAGITSRDIGSNNMTRYTVHKPELLGLGEQMKKGRTTKIFDENHIRAEKGRGNNLKINQYIKAGDGAVSALKSKAGWVGVVGGSVVNGAVDYFVNDEPLLKVAGNVGVDVGLGAVSLAAGGAVAAIAVGTFGAPLIAGAAISVGISIGASMLLDGFKIGKGKNRKSISDHVKSGVRSVAGWFKKKLS